MVPPKTDVVTIKLEQPVKEEPLSAKPPRLPIAQVVLFSSGVGYFQREGMVEGTARVDLSFPVQDINDLLKSMVLRDLDGDHISTVSYDSNAPVERTLKSWCAAAETVGAVTGTQVLQQLECNRTDTHLARGYEQLPDRRSQHWSAVGRPDAPYETRQAVGLR